MKKGQKKNVNTNKTILIIVLVMVAVVGYYCYLVSRSDAENEEP